MSKIQRRFSSIRLITIIILIFSMCFSVQASLTAKSNRYNRILYINSYTPNFPTFNAEYNGIKTVFKEKKADVDVEFMDCKRFNTPEDIQIFRESLSNKLKKLPPYQGLIVSDDDAFNFALDNQNTLFKNMPIVFFAVNDIDKALAQNHNPHMTGVMEAISVRGTLKLILDFFPKTQIIHIISDNSISGKSNLKTVLSYEKNYPNIKLDVISLNDYSFDEFYRKLATISPKEPALLLSAYEDKNHKKLTFRESLFGIKTHLHSPLFHLWRHGIGEGIIGGKVISSYDEGRLAAGILKRVLKGAKIDTMKVISGRSTNKYVFDCEYLKKYHIDSKLLPEDSFFVNEPVSFYEENKEIVIYTLIFISILVFLIILLGIITVKRKEAMKQLSMQNTKLEETRQELLIANKKVKESDRIKNEFIHNMSHEVRTPMNGLIGFAELLIANSDNNNEENKKYIAYIRESSNRLLRLLNDILEISKLDTNQEKIDTEDVNLNLLLTNLYYIFYERTEAKHILLSLHEPLSEKDSIFISDSKRLYKVINKLLDNALAYTDKGYIKMGYKVNDDMVDIFVEDSGIGISEELQEKIFESFSQEELHLSRKYEGLGLGLSIAQKNIQLLGGTISLISEKGKGSTFTIHLPFRKSNISTIEE